MPRPNTRVRLSAHQLEDRVVPSIESDIRARIAAEEAAAAARNQALLDAQYAELARLIAAEEERLRTPHDRIESNQIVLVDDFGVEQRRVQAYATDFTGGTWVASGDVTGDGEADFLTAPGKGAAATVRMFNGKTGSEIRAFDAYEPTFTGGAFVVTADLTGDAIAEVITGTDRGGGPVVAIYDGAKLAAGVTADTAQIFRFLAIEDPNFRGGVRVATGDVDGDGTPELVAAAGFGGGPRIAVFDGKMLAQAKAIKEFGDYFAFEPQLRDGSYPGVGDLNGDGRGELLIGAGPGGAPVVATFDPTRVGADGPANVSRFLAGNIEHRAGVRVSGFDGQGGKSYIIAADGRGGGAVIFDATGTSIRSYDRDLALGSGMFDDTSARNFFDPYGVPREATIDSLIGTYRGTTQAPVALQLGGLFSAPSSVPVTVELRIEHAVIHNLNIDVQASGGFFVVDGRVRLEIPNRPVIDESFHGGIQVDPFPNHEVPQTGSFDFLTENFDQSPIGLMTAIGLRWQNGTLTGDTVNFSFLNEFIANTLGTTTFTWTRV